MSDQQEEKNNICKWWLARGFALLPVQPNKKYLVQGYGEHKKKIVTSIEAQEMIEKYPGANLAVLGHGGTSILDFDIPSVYADWKEHHAQIETYTERTPRDGAHVFAFASAPSGLILIDGVELKKICLVYPSIVDGKPYTRGVGEIVEAGTLFFSALSKPGTKTAYVLDIEQRQKHERMPYGKKSLIDEIKQAHDILNVYALYRPDFKPERHVPYYSVCCPFHEDHKPSMYLDGVRQIYKCHACGARGDVINLYAHFEKISLHEAIARMAVNFRGGAS